MLHIIQIGEANFNHHVCFFFSVVLFIGIATLIELACVFLYTLVFAKLPIVKYYRAKAGKEGAKTVFADLAAAGLQEQAEQVSFGCILIRYGVFYSAKC